jgi:hypothetical protein
MYRDEYNIWSNPRKTLPSILYLPYLSRECCCSTLRLEENPTDSGSLAPIPLRRRQQQLLKKTIYWFIMWEIYKHAATWKSSDWISCHICLEASNRRLMVFWVSPRQFSLNVPPTPCDLATSRLRFLGNQDDLFRSFDLRFMKLRSLPRNHELQQERRRCRPGDHASG